MSGRYLTDLAGVCRSAGLDVVEVDGWQTRARSSGGYSTGRPTSVMVHHTASPPSADGWGDVNYICYGSSDRPLSNLYLDRNGAVWICAAGCTNTNGKGHDWWGGGVPDDSMNSYAIGIEAGNNGVGEPWPWEQQMAYVRLCRVLCDHYGIPYNNCRGHYEWAPQRKVDPAGPSVWAVGAESWNMSQFRNDVLEYGPPEPTPQEDEMATVILAVDGRNAQFIGQGPVLPDGTVHNLFVTWFGPGPDSDFLNDHRAAPDTKVQPTSMDTLRRDIVLLGNPEEIEDSTGRWSTADFYRVVRS